MKPPSAERRNSDRRPGTRRATTAAALGAILAQADPATRIHALLAFADTVPSAEIAAAIQQLRDSGITGLALATFDSDPSSALTWAASISDESKRTAAINKGVSEWIKRDPDATREWATSHNIALP